MEARISIIVIMLMIFVSNVGEAVFGQQMYQTVTENFVVNAPDPQLARRAATLAEGYRASLSQEWLGYEIETWQQRCPITIEIGPHAGGETSFGFVGGSRDNSVRAVPIDWKMNIFGPPDRVLDAVLPHEITHTIFATHFGRPLPRWADEGACTTVEHESERAKNHQLLMQFLTAKPSRGIPFNRMFTMKQYPHDILPLYAQGHSLAKFLIGKKDKRHFVNYIEAGLELEQGRSSVAVWNRVTKEFYKYENLSDLQIAWQSWVQAGCPEQAKAQVEIALVGYENQPQEISGQTIPVAPRRGSVGNQTADANSWYVQQAMQPENELPATSAIRTNTKVPFAAKDRGDHLVGDLRPSPSTEPFAPGSVSVPQFRPPNIPARRRATMSAKDAGTLWR